MAKAWKNEQLRELVIALMGDEYNSESGNMPSISGNAYNILLAMIGESEGPVQAQLLYQIARLQMQVSKHLVIHPFPLLHRGRDRHSGSGLSFDLFLYSAYLYHLPRITH